MALIFEVVRAIKDSLAGRPTIVPGPIESMEEFAKRNSDLLTFISQMPGPNASVAAFWQLTYMTAMHMRSGEPIFAISPTLAQLLQDTDIPRVELELLRLPFPCIVLDLAKCPMPIKDTRVVCIYLAQPEDKLRIFAGCEDSTGLFVNLITGAEYKINTILDAFDVTVAQSIVEGTRTIGDPILRALASWSKISHGWDDAKDKFMQEYKQILTVAINSVLYITSPESDVIRANDAEIKGLHAKLQGLKRGFKREHIEALLQKAKDRKIHVVGRSIVVQPEYTANYTDEGRKVAFRHKVRGHWKPHVRYGRGKELFKQKWIQPYWRGPTMAEMLVRNYVVDSPKDNA
jgi:hypothetical protein